MPRTKTLYCSFCGKSQHEVFLLVTATSARICDACVDVSVTLITKARDERRAERVGREQFATLQRMLAS